MPPKLFERQVELQVGDALITGLDVAFEVEKDLSPVPNNCHIDIFNLGPKNRAELSKHRRIPVTLKAGYKNALALLFKGDLLRCQHLKEGPTWKTSLSLGDALNVIQTKRLKKSYAKGTPLKSVIEDLIKELGLPAGNAQKELEKLNEGLTRGYSVSGNAMDELASILKGQGYSVSVQDGTLQILNNDKALEKEAISLTPDSGLIGTPETALEGEMSVKTVLMPELSPGRMVHIESAVFKGMAIIERVKFSGSIFGPVWDSDLTVRRPFKSFFYS